MTAYLIGEMDMITCKEDLRLTYVDANDAECVYLYIKTALSFGVVANNDALSATECGYPCVYASLLLGEIGGGRYPLEDHRYRKLSLSDLKPKPTKFVKVEESIFDLKEEFEKGDLHRVYAHHGDNPMYGVIDTEFSLIQAADRSNVYRKVEITERDLFIDMIEQAGAELSSDGEWSFACLAASVFDSGHIKLTDKPE